MLRIVDFAAGCPCFLLQYGHVSVSLGVLHAGALPLCAPAADGDAGIWCQLSPRSQQVGD